MLIATAKTCIRECLLLRMGWRSQQWRVTESRGAIQYNRRVTLLAAIEISTVLEVKDLGSTAQMYKPKECTMVSRAFNLTHPFHQLKLSYWITK